MTPLRSWIARHPLTWSFLLGAFLATIASLVTVNVYGIFLTPRWVEIVFSPGFLAGNATYTHLIKSTDLAVWAGIFTTAVVYGLVAMGIRMVIRHVGARKSS